MNNEKPQFILTWGQILFVVVFAAIFYGLLLVIVRTNGKLGYL